MSRPRTLSLVVVLALVALLGAQCQPQKKPPAPPRPGQLLGFYMTIENDFQMGFRSLAPHSDPVASGTSAQTLLPDGSVELRITNVGVPGLTSVLDGFTTLPFRLGDFATLQANLASAVAMPARLEFILMFDVNGNGDFFQWDGSGNLTGGGGDLVGYCKGITNAATLMMNDAETCELYNVPLPVPNVPIGSATIGQLKAGANGIDANTQVLAFVGLYIEPPMAGTNANMTVQSVLFNGIDLLVP